MAECNEAEWAAAKRQLFDAILPGGGGAGAATSRLDAMSLTPTRSPAAFASPFGPSQNGAAMLVRRLNPNAFGFFQNGAVALVRSLNLNPFGPSQNGAAAQSRRLNLNPIRPP